MPGYTEAEQKRARAIHGKLDFTGKRVLITGGGGYLGQRVAEDLLAKGCALVRTTDVRGGAWVDALQKKYGKDRVEFRACDLRNKKSVATLFDNERPSDKAKVDGVVHIASYGMSGREMLNVGMVKDVNVGGTETVIAACKAADCAALVYTSTANVVFCGKPLVNKDETLPYPPESEHSDYYSTTKTVAEREVLAQNGSATAGGASLRTCSIRPAGIYGEGEQRHLPRVIANLGRGLVSCIIGSWDTKVDWVYIDNLVFGHVLALDRLFKEAAGEAAVVSGQAYFISDENPMNQFEFFRPLIEGLGYKFPSVSIPVALAYYPAWLIELVHSSLKGVYDFTPLLTRTEVLKVSVTHYFSSAKARRDMGYAPLVSQDKGVARMVEDCKAVYGAEAKQAQQRLALVGSLLWYAFVFCVGMLLNFTFRAVMARL
eukprot:TRINITY_DN32227_c0_g1_i1.p1 TRINITY_DN32227_c0_g1~~TRINITY_DN32227_c0_g1_i1.p1  ORF type:complete len:430 (+),score=165.13 TRINITY_DN32227_c0_g1_i1:45-1334(+)